MARVSPRCRLSPTVAAAATGVRVVGGVIVSGHRRKVGVATGPSGAAGCCRSHIRQVGGVLEAEGRQEHGG
jgi:hypothetical protein